MTKIKKKTDGDGIDHRLCSVCAWRVKDECHRCSPSELLKEHQSCDEFRTK